MAEAPAPKGGDKKPDKKPEKKPVLNPNALFAELIAIAIVLYVLYRIFLSFGGGTNGGLSFQERFHNFLVSFGIDGLVDSAYSAYLFLISLLSMLFIMGIIYTLVRLHTLEKLWKEKIGPAAVFDAEEKPKNERWERVVAHISSDNASDWRLAILESDIILDELLDNLGYVGGTIGDKLKNADSAQFRTINYAWEAHKIRNAIAHEGQDFTLTQREARRIIGLYETVFREFDFI
ncbi:MAG: protein of unknown function with transrane region [Candidatus Paceibacter sp.]|jgi:hypothetical protein|nr:protein of unknown function with transrane region [Candidatus Paceibacter sp.]